MNTKEKYQEYLKTDYWKQVSAEVQKRAGHRCQLCNSPERLEAHHRTYAHRGDEMNHLEDLICLCRGCHGHYHKPVEEAVKVKTVIKTVIVKKVIHVKRPAKAEKVLYGRKNILRGLSRRDPAAIRALSNRSGYSFHFLYDLRMNELNKLVHKYL